MSVYRSAYKVFPFTARSKLPGISMNAAFFGEEGLLLSII